MRGAFLDVGLRAFIIDELQGVAVVQVVAGIALVVANGGVVEHEVEEYTAVKVGDEAADLEENALAEAELQALAVIVFHQFVEQSLVLLLEAYLAGTGIEPLDVVLGEEGINDGGPRLAYGFASKESHLLHGVGGEGLFGFVTVAAASSHHCAGNGYRHHPSEGLVMFHILQSFKYWSLYLYSPLDSEKTARRRKYSEYSINPLQIYKMFCKTPEFFSKKMKILHGYHVNLIPNGKEKLNGCSVR